MKVIIELDSGMLEEIRENDFDFARNAVRNFQATIADAIRNGKLIQDGATNGNVIKVLFPNCEQKEPIYNGYFEMYFDNDLGNASYMRVSKDFWDAKYKKEVKE